MMISANITNRRTPCHPLILEFSERNMPQFLDDAHIVEALNGPVDDSGSQDAKLFVIMGNVLRAGFFSVNFHCVFNKFFTCFYRNYVSLFIFKL